MAIVVGLIVAAIVVAALRTQRRHRVVVRLALAAGVVFVAQAIVGGLQVLTQLAAWTQTLHVALGAIVWALVCALAVTAYYTARVEAPLGSGLVSGRATRRRRRRASACDRRRRQRVRQERRPARRSEPMSR